MSKSLKKLIDINRLREFKNKLVGTDSPYVQTGAVDQTVAGTKTFSKPIVGSVTGSSGSCTGNAATATKLATARSLWGNNFDGSAAITGKIMGTPAIELMPADTSNNGGYLDFHYNQSTADYTSRIIESASGTLSINNVTITTGKVVTAATFNGALKGNVTGNCSGSSGSCTGNAATATQFSANATVALTGDATGTSAGSKKGWSVPVTLANSGVTAGTYGPSADVTGNNNATISVPQITVDAKGRVTSVTNRTLTCKNNTYSVYNKTLTIQKNGTNVATFTSNSNTDVTANITVPTKTSELTNDSGYLTSHQSLSNYVTLNGTQTISGAKTFTGDVIGINKDNSTEDANSLYSTTAGSKLTYYTTLGGKTTLTNVPAAVNTTLESRTLRRLSDSDWVVEQICHNSFGLYYRKGISGTWGAWKTFAFTDSDISGNAATATKATGNANGKELTNTIIKGLSISGKTITYTQIDGTTGTLTTQDTNTDTLMTQNVSTTNATYPILLCPTANATANQGAKTGIFGSGVKVNPSTSTITATTFSGALTGNVTGNVSGSSGSCTGNAATATKLAAKRTIALSGAATGTATAFDGSGNIAIPVTSLDASKLTGTASVSTTGNAATATKLATARSLWGNNFDGSAAITGKIMGTPAIELMPADTSNNGGVLDFHYNQSTADYTSRIIESASGTLSINGVTITTGKVVTAATFNGALKGNVTGNCSGSSGSCTGNAATATKLATARTIALSGAATGTATGFDGSGNITIPVTALASSAIRAQWYAAYPDGAEAHNAMWGGRDITAAFNNGTVSANIANGTFKDIFPGDYITKQVTIAGTTYTVNWVIADCDYWINKGDTATTAHHVAIVPQAPIFNAHINDTNTTEGGYASSWLHTFAIPPCATGIVNAFGSDHILTFRDAIPDRVDTSHVSSGIPQWTGTPKWWGVWHSEQCNLMSEKMVFGAPVCSGGAMNNAMATRQMSAFRLSERLINYNRNAWWLRDVVSSVGFAVVDVSGNAAAPGASFVLGVRPFALLC